MKLVHPSALNNDIVKDVREKKRLLARAFECTGLLQSNSYSYEFRFILNANTTEHLAQNSRNTSIIHELTKGDFGLECWNFS
jgi:hypothetical protein